MTQVSLLTTDPHDDSQARRDKRALILEAAIQVFANKGYHGSRVSDIAQEAGIAYGLVYHYFKNKEQILNEIFEDQWGGFLEVVEGIAGNDAPVQDKFVSIAALILNAFRVRPEWVKVLVLEIQRSSRFAEPTQVQAVGRLFQLVARIVREGQARGELREDLDADVACSVFIGALDLVITSLVLGVREIEGSDDQQREYYLNVARNVVEILLKGLAPR